MKKEFLLLFTFIFSLFTAYAQDFQSYIKANVIKIEKLDSLNNDVWHVLSDYKLIMVGELHGTNEPAKLVVGLTQLLTGMRDSVQVGIEIPSEKMTEYLNQPNDNSIYSTEFFVKNSDDGRASVAWAEMILKLNKNHKVRIFFFDVNKGESKSPGDRDSIMYLKVKNKIKLHPGWKTITLSGNIHNMLLPYKEKITIAFYLSRDNELNLSGRIFSLNHQYGSGTMLNNTGKGLEMHSVDNSFSDYFKAVDYENYLLLLPANVNNRYNGIFFTRSVTAAQMVK